MMKLVRYSAIAVAVLLSFSLGAAFHSLAVGEQPPAAEQKTIYVLPGDTLWSIAETYKPDGMDTRQYIYELKKINGLTSSRLQVGQALIVI